MKTAPWMVQLNTILFQIRKIQLRSLRWLCSFLAATDLSPPMFTGKFQGNSEYGTEKKYKKPVLCATKKQWGSELGIKAVLMSSLYLRPAIIFELSHF